MAFDGGSMIRLGYGESNGHARSAYLYSTNDTLANIQTAGYWAAWGSTSGNGVLKTYDVIIVSLDEDGTPASYIMVVSDAAAGTTAAGVALNDTTP